MSWTRVQVPGHLTEDLYQDRWGAALPTKRSIPNHLQAHKEEKYDA
jgi:hypothetical protein